MRRKILVLLMMSPSLLMAQQIKSGCEGKIMGHVYDANSKAALAGVVLEITQTEISLEGLKGRSDINISDSTGNYLAKKICKGRYTMTVSYIGYKKQEIRLRLSEEKIYHLDVFLQEDPELLKSIEISAQNELSNYSTQTLDRPLLDQSSGKTLADALKVIPGVNSFNTGNNIAKPVIQGLHSNRVLILNNGIRQEGQQWGAEHAPEIDPFLAQKITLVKGALGVRYGSDAIGGVVMIEPPALDPTNDKLRGHAQIVAMSNNRLGAVSSRLEGKIKSVKKDALLWAVQGTYRRGGDYFAPSYNLSNTGLEEMNFSLNTAYHRKSFKLEAFFSSFNTRLGILRSSQASTLPALFAVINRQEPVFERDFSYDINNPQQKVSHQLLKTKASGLLGKGEWQAQYGLQINNRKEFDIRRGGRSSIPVISVRLTTQTLDFSYQHPFSEYFKAIFGTSTFYQYNYNIPDEKVGILIPDYDQWTQGVYLIGQYQKNQWAWEAGLRYDYRDIKVFIDQLANQPVLEKNYQLHNFSAVVAGTHHWSKHWKITTSLGTAFRPPNVNEMLSRGLHQGSGSIERGLLYDNNILQADTSLYNETAYKWTTSLMGSYSKVNLELTGYYNYISNFIFLSPDRPELTVRGAFPVMNFRQTNADFLGAEGQATYLFLKNWSWISKASWLYARDLSRNDVLINMPPWRLENTLEFSKQNWRKLKNFKTGVNMLYVAQQNRAPRVITLQEIENLGEAALDQMGIFDYAPAPEAYTLFSLFTEIEVPFEKNILWIQLGVENAFNVSYRDYLNRFRYFVDEPGRNFTLRMKYSFN